MSIPADASVPPGSAEIDDSPGLALLFPGQGAQQPGMGVGLFDAGSIAHGRALEASEILGIDVVHLTCTAGPDEIRPTDIAQPLLLLHSVALLELLTDVARAAARGVAGHSLGEYTALVAAGVLGWRDALRLVRERGLAMAAAASSALRAQGMSAVLGLPDADVERVLSSTDGEVVVANLNAPGQVVISGYLDALETIAEALRSAGARRVIRLEVGGAFHSPLMAGAADRVERAIDGAPLAPGSISQAFNVDGGLRRAPDDVADALRRQLVSAVRWTDCVASLRTLGCGRFIEIGPGSTLTGLGRRIAPEASWTAIDSPAAAQSLSFTGPA